MSLFKNPYIGVTLTIAVFLPAGYFGALAFEAQPEKGPAGAIHDTEKKSGRSSHQTKTSSPNKLDQVGMATGSDLIEQIMTATVEELPELPREILKGSNGVFIRAVIDRWVELNPEAGWAFFLKERKSGNRWKSAIYTYSGRWALADPDAAFSATLNADDENVVRVGIDRIGRELANQRPLDYFRLSQGQGGEKLDYYRRIAARRLAMSKPQEALALLGELPPSMIYEKANPYQSGAQEKALLENLLGLPSIKEAEEKPAREQDSLSADIAAGWATNDPNAAITWVRNIESDQERGRALRAIATGIIESDPERAAQLLKEAAEADDPSNRPHRSYDQFRYSWQTAAEILSHRDPTAAIAWVAKHYPESAVQEAASYLPPDGVAAVKALAALPDESLTDGRLKGWPNSQWRPQNLEAAIAEVKALPESDKRDSIHAWILNAMTSHDPEAALNGAVNDLADSPSRTAVLKKSAEMLARDDVSAAAAWIEQRETGSEKDTAIEGFIAVAQHVEPDVALEWAAHVSNEEVRQKQIRQIYDALAVATSTEAAQEALRESSLPDEDIARFLK